MNPDRTTHGSETCLALVTVIVILGLLAAVIGLIVDAYG